MRVVDGERGDLGKTPRVGETGATVKATSNEEKPVAAVPGAVANTREFYRQRAAECREIARTASDREAREEWLRLANRWTSLALHSER